jgi:hypothetical protein
LATISAGPFGRLSDWETLCGYRHPSASWPVAQPGGARATVGADEAEVSSRRRRSAIRRLGQDGGTYRAVKISRPQTHSGLGRTSPLLASPFKNPCVTPALGRKLSPSPAHSPRLCAALSPTRSADNGYCQRISPSAEAEFLARQIRRPSPSSACASALRCRPPRPCFFVPQRGTRWRWASGPRRKTRIFKMASNRSKTSPKREIRTALTFEMALQLCPQEVVAESGSVLDGNPGSNLSGNRQSGDRTNVA